MGNGLKKPTKVEIKPFPEVDLSSIFKLDYHIFEPMFAMSRTRLSLSLENLRKGVCSYGPGAKRCDCKFLKEGEANGEQTGCCELRTAIAMLDALTDEEAAVLQKRAKLTLVEDE